MDEHYDTDATNAEPHHIEKVIGPDGLLNATSSGWTVIERFEHDAPIQLFEMQPGSPHPYHGGDSRMAYDPPSIHREPPYGSTVKTAVGRVSAFRVRLSSACLVAELQADLEKFKEKVSLAAEAQRKVEEALKKKDAEHLKALETIEQLKAENGRVRTDRQQIEQCKRNLERDLGKIREQMGRKQFEEIIPPLAATAEAR